MASRNLPPNYPAALGRDLLKADAHRQASILQQEFVTELIGLLSETRDPGVRSLLLRTCERHLKAGIAAAQKSEGVWPELEDARERIEKDAEASGKAAAARKHLKLFEQLDRVHQRSLGLLRDSFQHIRIILDRLQTPDPTPSAKNPDLANKPSSPSSA